MVTVVILESLTKYPGINSTFDPIVTWEILDVVMLPFDEQFFAFQVNVVGEQPLNAELPIVETFLPIEMADKLEQFWKALLPIEVTEFGMVILVRLEQFWKL